MTYADAGVDRVIRFKAKRELEELKTTYSMSKHGRMIETPFNTLYPIGFGKYHVKTADGVGTKVLLSQLAGKHDTIGIDAVAMVVNDVIRCGAEPLALTNIIDIKKSSTDVISAIEEGLRKAAAESDCPIVGGETADLPDVMASLYHINCDCVGEVRAEQIITGMKIKLNNVVIGLRSSGIHSNGMSLARKVLMKKWGGAFDEFDVVDTLSEELIFELLKPTRIYVKPFHEIMKWFDINGAVHVTGDAYIKFNKLSAPGLGFELNYFKPQPIFDLIQKTGNIDTKEMFSTFNMGWGFALIVDGQDAEDIIQRLSRYNVESEIIGKVVASRRTVIKHDNKKFLL